MAQVTLCDHRDNKGQPCGDRANVTASLLWDGKKFEIDLCDVHSKSLTANAREASAPAAPQVTRLPTVGPRGRKTQEQLVDKIDYPDLRAWLEGQGDLPAGGKGRIKQELQQKWVDAGEPRPV